jgi:DNA-binding NarL/FixJ family response regulator
MTPLREFIGFPYRLQLGISSPFRTASRIDTPAAKSSYMNWSRSMKSLVVDDHALIREALRGALNDLKGDIAILEAGDSRHPMAIVGKNADLGLILLREMILSALRLVFAGSIYIPPEILREWSPAPRLASPRVATGTRLGAPQAGEKQQDDMPRARSGTADRQESRHGGSPGLERNEAHRVLGLILLREMMMSALRLVFARAIYISPEILHEWSPAPSLASSRVATDTTRVITADPRLTKRQLEILALLRQGKSNKAICRALDLAQPTVKNHVTAILKAFKATNRTEAVIAAMRLENRASAGLRW